MTRPARRIATAALASLALVAAGAASAASITHTVTFQGAGGDAGYGSGDTSTKTALFGGFLPLFDSSLGTLEAVSIEMSAWRSIAFDCTQGMAGTMGGCSARASGQFVLRADSYDPYQFPVLASLVMDAGVATGLAPERGQTLSAVSWASGSTSAHFTDPALLSVHFDGAGKNPALTYFTWLFYGTDGGSIGQGGAAALTRLYWDADATVAMTYHYTAAVPEPGAYALMLAGLGTLGWVVRRRRRA